ncbi:MAG: protein kinase [Proteobacteria bacterium]|nr:protein kinase [Pseudomonadota bacterium]
MQLAQQLGRYHMLDRIAYGGMAEIFRGKTFDSEGREHLVAIKRLFRSLAEDDAFLQMLIDEARIASVLNHPNIARVYEFARCDDEYFLAMEYVDGKDLRALIDLGRTRGILLPIEHLVLIISDALDGLHFAHEQVDADGRPLDIVHRDVSPSNVLVSYAGAVKLCDFGIAKATLSQVQTRAGVIKGKIRYMSPEQTRGLPLDRRSDVFSMGAVFYELLTQRPAFEAESDMGLIVRVREARYEKPTRYNPDLPRPVLRILQRALARSPEARYATAADFADDLRGYLSRAHPRYERQQLARLMSDLFAREIAESQRRLNDFVLGQADPEALGDDLLGIPSQAHTLFSPVLRSEPATERSAVHEQAAGAGPAPDTDPERELSPPASLHSAQTQLLDLGVPARPAPAGRRPGAAAAELEPLDAEATGVVVDFEAASAARTVPITPTARALHEAPTLLLAVPPAASADRAQRGEAPGSERPSSPRRRRPP